MAPSYDKTIATAASLAASLMLVRSLASELLPAEVRGALSAAIASLRSRMTWQHTIVIEETEGWSSNRVYSAVKAYLATRINANINMQRLRVSSGEDAEKMVVSMEAGEEMADVYEGAEFKWCLVTREVSGDLNNGGGGAREIRSYEVSFNKRHKEKALKEYLPFIVATAKAIKDQERSLSIYMNERYDEWSPIDLQHPSTFDTLAMDQKQKQSIVDDLDRFIKRKEYYRKTARRGSAGTCCTARRAPASPASSPPSPTTSGSTSTTSSSPGSIPTRTSGGFSSGRPTGPFSWLRTSTAPLNWSSGRKMTRRIPNPILQKRRYKTRLHCLGCSIL
ncbi:hypothetical protein ACQJBY_004420 [Aegilops geniculata]